MAIRNSRRSLLQAMGAAAIGVSFGGLAACTKGAEKKKLNFYNWDTYIGETTLEDFEKETGTAVNMSLFATNDELFAKMKTGNSGFDVIVPSNDFVTRLYEAQLLTALDHAKIPNFKNVDPVFMDPSYDPGRKFSAPYTWLVLGLGYRKSKMKDAAVPDSWKWVFDSDAYKGKIALLSESGDLVRLAAKYKGWSVNGLTKENVDEIAAMLIKQKPNIKAFHSDNGQAMLQAGDVDIVIEYNGDIAQVMAEEIAKNGKTDLDFVVPKEGSQLNSDNWCIPKTSTMVDEAHAFINYMLDAKAGAEISKTILYPTPNAAAKALMPDDYKNNTVIFPPAEVLAKCEYANFEGAEKAQMLEEAMTKVKA